MKRLVFFLALVFFFGCVCLPASVLADSGHARIVRLSLVQGDVRYARQYHKDALDDTKAMWEPAPLNLPIREGFAVATDNDARAEVEFENGAMAFLSGNTVIEFYDLSLDDGALITRLVLRQGSAIFYVHPARGDFFSVTGGDFSVQADGRSRFRLDNYDDGSMVSVEQGQVAVLHKKETKILEKGQSYSIALNESQNAIIARAPDSDAFDKWVSGRIDSVVTATTYANDYVSSPAYSSGFADLYNYGNWYNLPGYGYGWQPFGVGAGWCPFAFGSWGYDPFLGWNFISSAPWGWLPYHYGGWLFNPGLGWMWVPTGFGYGNGPVVYRPVTGVWVHSGGVNGIVPLHPADVHGKPPINLHQGVYAVHGNTIAANPIPAVGEKWNVVNRPAREILSAVPGNPAPAPTKVSRTILSGTSGGRVVTLSRDSSIVYDPAQHRFVSSGDPARTPTATESAVNSAHGKGAPAKPPAATAVAGNSAAKPGPPSAPRANVPRPNVAPPSPTSSMHSSHGGGAVWSGPASTNAGAGHSSSGSSGISGGHASGGGGGGHH